MLTSTDTPRIGGKPREKRKNSRFSRHHPLPLPFKKRALRARPGGRSLVLLLVARKEKREGKRSNL
ncbi:hypothetical protein AKJ36_02530 [candidate division MSBL1 archaeon SCGC-AAA259I07]|uniref:Uncharacterized protein n=1 Tax=candidate division MSBL1 archaeon SCGC-AAA259I07 TaxID=1698266 RepID=A0A133UK97_9EURY|nr:hypothetical protein AKJ36_02530 [candidate division MSBL1 archaeon SCGC-AAA259I07]